MSFYCFYEDSQGRVQSHGGSSFVIEVRGLQDASHMDLYITSFGLQHNRRVLFNLLLENSAQAASRTIQYMYLYLMDSTFFFADIWLYILGVYLCLWQRMGTQLHMPISISRILFSPYGDFSMKTK